MRFLDDLRKWRQGFAALESELERKRQRAEFLETAPLPRAEFAAMLCETIDRDAANFGDDLRRSVESVVRKPFFQPHEQWRPAILHFQTHPGTGAQPHALYAIFPEQIKTAVRREIENADWYPAADECGPPRAEREAEMAKLGAEIERLEQQIETARSEASREGVRL